MNNITVSIINLRNLATSVSEVVPPSRPRIDGYNWNLSSNSKFDHFDSIRLAMLLILA